MKSRKKAVFLDRDGVINKSCYRGGVNSSPRKISELIFIDNIRETLDKLRNLNFELVVITNQPDISRGLMTQKDLSLINEAVRVETGLNNIYVCPHDNQDRCKCRKPKTGLIEQAISDLNLDTYRSYLIGDRESDVQAGITMNLRSILLTTNFNINQTVSNFIRCSDLYRAVEVIENQEKFEEHERIF